MSFSKADKTQIAAAPAAARTEHEQTNLQRRIEPVGRRPLEARYPDEKFSFYKRCSREFTEHYLMEIEETMTWLRRLIPSSTP